MKVYVAASSAEMDRVARVIGLLGAAGIDVTCTWPAVVAATPGGANPRDAQYAERHAWSAQDLAEVKAADVLLFLVPNLPAVTRGAWFEAGYALAIGKRLICAGSNTSQSVFCALGDEFDDDEAAVRHVAEQDRRARGARIDDVRAWANARIDVCNAMESTFPPERVDAIKARVERQALQAVIGILDGDLTQLGAPK